MDRILRINDASGNYPGDHAEFQMTNNFVGVHAEDQVNAPDYVFGKRAYTFIELSPDDVRKLIPFLQTFLDQTPEPDAVEIDASENFRAAVLNFKNTINDACQELLNATAAR